MSAIYILPGLEFLHPPENHQDWQTIIRLIDNKEKEIFVIPFRGLRIEKGDDGDFYIEVSTTKHCDALSAILSNLQHNPQLQISWNEQHSISFKKFQKVTAHIEVAAPLQVTSTFFFVCSDYQKSLVTDN